MGKNTFKFWKDKIEISTKIINMVYYASHTTPYFVLVLVNINFLIFFEASLRKSVATNRNKHIASEISFGRDMKKQVSERYVLTLVGKTEQFFH